MANSNRVFVSPGVYTSEKDLTFVAQSVGVTTLGIVGETLKGPAFEPVLVTNYDEFKNYFGTTSPEKDVNSNPKYELPYVAKSYLQESNQLFVTRVLGLTGYKKGNTYSIKTLGSVVVDMESTPSTSTSSVIPTLTGVTGSTIYNQLSGNTTLDGTTVATYVVSNYSGNTVSDNGSWFVLGSVPTSATSGLTGTQLNEPLGTIDTNYNSNIWANQFYNQTGSISGVTSYLFVYSSGTTRFDVTGFTYSAAVNTDYDGVTVAALRSRGEYSGNTLNKTVTGTSAVTISSVLADVSPNSEFTLSVTKTDNTIKTFDCSLSQSSSKYISKVLGDEVYGKASSDFPLYVHEVYPNLVDSLFKKGLIRGLDLTSISVNTDDDFKTQWDTPASPMVVSEVRGGSVFELFQILTISDGEAANFEVKVTIQNINLETLEFDLIVRDFNDTDENQLILEKFSRCSMNPDAVGYIAKRVGTSDGDYELRSKYIMINLADNAPIDALPAGFKGFTANNVGGNLGSVLYKTTYYDSGDVVGYTADSTEIITNGDKIKKVSLGLSSQIGFDSDLFKFKGTQSVGSSYGFHLSTNASTITGLTYMTTPYDLEGQTGNDNKLTNINYRKFTFAVCGGFDGWDIFRKTRTNTDSYIFGKNQYTSSNTTNGGVFSTSLTSANSDYYAFLKGIETFQNPESVDINLFATPGINFHEHSSLVTQAIDMVENDRADSLYVIDAPGPSTINSVDEIVDALDSVGLDSNYSATYWPWIQIRDTDNATQLYVSPTAEVVKNIALTDNVSYPWFAPAGYQRGLVNAVKAQKKLKLDERDSLYANRINPIATFSDTGTIIWGNKTLQVKESALDRINVRRLLLRTRKLISAVAVRLIFEQNDDQVRQEFLRLVNPILESIKKERGLYDFKVVVSNDPEDIDANTLRGKIYIKPTRALEFVDVEFIITPTGASFENV